LSLSRYEGTN